MLVTDHAFPLTRHIMKPLATNLIKGSPRRVNSYRLSRARRLVKNAFGLLSSVFRILPKPIEVKVDNTVSDIVLACVCLDPRMTLSGSTLTLVLLIQRMLVRVR
nr:unnamed protein product [Callosobruchus analis]